MTNKLSKFKVSATHFAIGFPLGLPIAVALGNIALFPIFGILFALIIAALEQREGARAND